MNAKLPLVLQVFALLFSRQWLDRWQEGWRRQQLLERPAGVPGMRKKKKLPPGRFYERIFSLRVTLWYLIFQRLNFDHALAAVVVDLREGQADRLGRRGARKLSQRVRSAHTSAYNQARQRLPLALLVEALAHLRQGLLQAVGWEPIPRQAPRPEQRTRQ